MGFTGKEIIFNRIVLNLQIFKKGRQIWTLGLKGKTAIVRVQQQIGFGKGIAFTW